MSLRINTNVSSIQAQTNVSRVSREMEESFSKLSSGLRITKAADDAAGLAISENMKAQIRSSKQADRNANDGISLVQVAEGGLNEASSILTRMRELSIQAATETLADSDRYNSNLEYQHLKKELERISQVTEFNGTKLLNGQGKALDFQVGMRNVNAQDRLSYDTAQLNAGIESLGVGQITIASKEDAQTGLTNLDQAISKISSYRSLIGSLQNRLISSSNNLSFFTENMSSSNSRIRDLDYAAETANQARNSIVSSASTMVLAQANVTGKNALKLVE